MGPTRRSRGRKPRPSESEKFAQITADFVDSLRLLSKPTSLSEVADGD
jgi:hypothetical protein